MIADWGNKRVYMISDIDFKSNPVSKKFIHNGEEKSIAQYMNDVYNKEIKDFNQPLIVVKHGDEFIHLPPEFCRIDGVPDSIRASPGMRDALAVCRTTPEAKMREVVQMMQTLMQQQVLKDFEVSVNSAPVELTNQMVLPEPQIFKHNQVIHINENVLRRLPIQKPIDLTKDDWIMVYQSPSRPNGKFRSNFTPANNVYESFIEAQKMLGMRIQEPTWFELENEADMVELEQKIQAYLTQGDRLRHPKMLVMVLGNETIYKQHKQLYKQY